MVDCSDNHSWFRGLQTTAWTERKCIITPYITADRKINFKKYCPGTFSPKHCYSAASPQLHSCILSRT